MRLPSRLCGRLGDHPRREASSGASPCWTAFSRIALNASPISSYDEVGPGGIGDATSWRKSSAFPESFGSCQWAETKSHWTARTLRPCRYARLAASTVALSRLHSMTTKMSERPVMSRSRCKSRSPSRSPWSAYSEISPPPGQDCVFNEGAPGLVRVQATVDIVRKDRERRTAFVQRTEMGGGIDPDDAPRDHGTSLLARDLSEQGRNEGPVGRR